MIRLFQNYAFGKQSRMLFSTPNYSTFTSENDIEQEPGLYVNVFSFKIDVHYS